MRAEVRDDIIKLETFVVAKFKHEKYIELIYDCGGYCFIDQFAHHYGKNQGRYIIRQMEKDGLIKTKSFNNYKYCYLTDAAVKYIMLKDSPQDFSDKGKNEISVKRISVKPTDKVLFASALKFAIIHESEIIGKSHYEKVVRMEIEEMKRNEKLKQTDLKDVLDSYLLPIENECLRNHEVENKLTELSEG